MGNQIKDLQYEIQIIEGIVNPSKGTIKHLNDLKNQLKKLKSI